MRDPVEHGRAERDPGARARRQVAERDEVHGVQRGQDADRGDEPRIDAARRELLPGGRVSLDGGVVQQFAADRRAGGDVGAQLAQVGGRAVRGDRADLGPGARAAEARHDDRRARGQQAAEFAPDLRRDDDQARAGRAGAARPQQGRAHRRVAGHQSVAADLRGHPARGLGAGRGGRRERSGRPPALPCAAVARLSQQHARSRRQRQDSRQQGPADATAAPQPQLERRDEHPGPGGLRPRPQRRGGARFHKANLVVASWRAVRRGRRTGTARRIDLHHLGRRFPQDTEVHFCAIIRTARGASRARSLWLVRPVGRPAAAGRRRQPFGYEG